MRRALVVVVAAVLCMAAASDPSERLPDPAQEAAARAIFQEVRCLVCQNESINDSDAELARDLRRVVREQVAAGRDEAQVKAFLTDRYGEYVLLKPAFSLGNAALWLGPFAALLAGLAFLVLRVRRRDLSEGLTVDEEARLARLLEDRDA
ncbi:MAG: cytochrome c-type biogenesis protein CcmH [Caulobacter sp.]|nr:cytochrome c-type biogenesis protein CcmH [Caulobacter sp.]